jgi:hypothetical protein
MGLVLIYMMQGLSLEKKLSVLFSCLVVPGRQCPVYLYACIAQALLLPFVVAGLDSEGVYVAAQCYTTAH